MRWFFTSGGRPRAGDAGALRWLVSVLLFALACGVSGPAHAEGRAWVRLDNCRYFDSPALNGADSFQVRCGKKQFVLRLYAVDAPVTDPTLLDRIKEQSYGFGASEDQVLKFGRTASMQVRRRLLGRDFTIWTRWVPAQAGSRIPRYHGFLEVDGGDLGQWLLSRGYARAKGAMTDAPRGGGSANDLQRRLSALEKRAKRERRGIWGVASAVARSREPT